MTSDLHQKLNLPYSHINESILGINNGTSHINKMCFVPMMSLSGDFATNLKCFVLPSLTDNVPSRSVDLRELNIPTNLPLADPSFHEPAAIDIILGADIFWKVIGTQKLNLGFGKPILCETKLGWIVSGPIINKQNHCLSQSFKCHFSVVNPDSVSSNDSIQNQLTLFWSLEEHRLCEEHFINNTTRVNGQFCVKIPLKENPSILGNSLHRAVFSFFRTQIVA
ncbi:hypothetical protein K1T71_015153 [Dendrolimus kikuchii]|nr:hypothetical protein K1T71_015153 [Dendrolimus kikuchii]